ncbi:MAG TPA: DNA-binding protein [Bacteroidales bacterium]|nr:DNA-binding protein [Bacteroidales bacterium]
MSGLFTIPIGGMKEGYQSFDFEIGNEFFELFEGSEISEGVLKACVNADKRSSHIDLAILIDGAVKISCDRCLGIFSLPVHCENRLMVQFGKPDDENDPDIITIPADEHELDLCHYFYEYILLALPIKRLHPDDENGNSTCDPEMISRLKEHMIRDDIGTDPRWDGLKKIMNN